MPLTENQVKANIKAKLQQARNNITSADESLDFLVEAIYEVVKSLLQDATVTGICPPNGGILTQGKIT
ncbi:hypothetical protein AB670_02753 [Chryseobacterium sp. MOF25P]|uniref:hypothetical protein n=1 Tax=unclassified Chryseobacterium TaxID=2593645 RepID=UPI000805BE04|nr:MULTISPECIES: hypothetical protein [unclassified Chryseobacterium]OBW40802.1 hypothetical protein AB670_02753 [Chryseobacterium sp. MOF25P]OBW45266.1 hypothetical protein AB671_02563 [Chryseobacterium sp. BGARF1]